MEKGGSAPSGRVREARAPCERKLKVKELMYAQVEDQPGSGQAFSQNGEGMEVLFGRPPPQSRPQVPQDQAPAALRWFLARAQERFAPRRPADAQYQVMQARTN